MARSSWFYDAIASIVLIIFFTWKRQWFHFNTYSTSLVCAAIIFHNLGTLGYYAVSPLFMQYDHFTHLFGFVACAFFIHGIIVPYFKGSRTRLYFLIFMACLGAGTLIEMSEFIGYLFLGEGEGMFFLGAGDFGGDLGPVFASDVAKEWIDSMWDLIYNALGTILGIFFLWWKHE